MNHQNLSRKHIGDLPFFLIRAKSPQFVFPKVTGQTAGPGSGSREQYYPPALLFPACQILNQHLKTILIGADIFHCKAKLMADLHSGQLLIQARQHHRSTSLNAGHHLRRRVEKLCLSRKDIAVFQTVGHAFSKFQFYRLAFLLQAQRLIQVNKTGLFREIIQKGHGFSAEIPDIAIQTAQTPAFPNTFHKFFYSLTNTMSRLALVLISQRFLVGFLLLLDSS